MKTRILLSLIGSLLLTVPARAQHEHHQHQADTSRTALSKATDHSGHNPAEANHDVQHDMQMDGSAESLHHMEQMNAQSSVPMGHSFSLNLPMNRNGSGTGWLPDASPMYGYMVHGHKWMYMVHGNVFLRYNSQDITNKGTRGDTKVDAPNWVMAMGQRRVGSRGLFRLGTMFSLDPLFGGEGYPLLFQTGETYQGRPLVDRQHPHNFFSELSVGYTHMINRDLDAFVYLAYPGEPALGPVAFMHRPSAQNNLDSPLGHHWQDATHVTFGVATLGVRYKIFKLEGSVFTGREPGEARYGFDKPRFDSYAYRLSANPHPQLALQASQAYIKSPEPLEPGENVRRTTASVLHALPLLPGNYNLNSALVWGFNDAGGHHKEHSLTAESNLQLDRFAVYGRYEYIQKSAGELQAEGFEHDRLFDVNAVTLGTNYTVLRAFNTNLSLGVQGSLYLPGKDLYPIYGKNPLAGQVYLRLYPHLMRMGGK